MNLVAANTPISATPPNSRRSLFVAGLLLVAATVIAYSNSFNGPFVFDDVGTILNNPALQEPLNLRTILTGPPGGTTASGRPVVFLSLVINHALGGFDVRGYHAVNLALHLAAGLTLFGVVRRLLLTEPLRKRFTSVALPIAFASAAVWLLHPLQTAAVTYIVQRAEVLASLFYLLTLYGFLRAAESPAPRRWQFVSVVSCLFGLASKEIAVSAPLFVLLCDRTLVSGSFTAAWRQRRGYYLALAGTWLVLIALVLSTQNRGGSVGTDGLITPWTYALTQCRAIVHYLRLAAWPTPLIFDYGTACETSFSAIAPQAALLAALTLATGFALWKRSPVGQAGVWFFAILAPSSSVLPVLTQTMAEHRLYLPLAAIIVLLTTAATAVAGPRSVWVFLGVAALFGGLTFHRNADYRSAISIWADTAAKHPRSKRAHNNLGTALTIEGRNTEAIAAFTAAVNIDPFYESARTSLGRLHLQEGNFAKAANNFANALRGNSQNAEAQYGLGVALASSNQFDQAVPHLREAVRLEPATTDWRLKLAQTLFRTGDATAAIDEFREVTRHAPNLVDAHSGLGTALASLKRFPEAQLEFTEALRLNPDDVDAHYNLGNVLIELDRVAEAIPHYEQVLRLRPDHAGARNILPDARAYLNASH